MKLKKPPGPHAFTRWEQEPNNRIEYLTLLQQRYGNIARMSYIPKIYVISDPLAVERILITEADNFTKEGFFFKRLARGLGDGLVTTLGDTWQQSRKLLQPKFQWSTVKRYGDMMQQGICKRMTTWEKKIIRHKPIDMGAEMMSLVLENSSEILFGHDLTKELRRMIHAVKVGNRFIIQGLPFPRWMPTPANIRFSLVSRWMHQKLLAIIQQRKQSSTQRDDLLAVLIDACQDQGKTYLDDEQLVHEVRTFLLTGHETTGNLLSWTCYLLASHPDIMSRLQQEIQQVIGHRAVNTDDLPNLPFGHMILQEALRLYPPTWGLIRRVKQTTELNGYRIPKNHYVLTATYLLQRHPDYWDRPNDFIPDRFSKDNKVQRHKCCYIPFGIGQRTCIGGHFAMLQAHIILTTIAQRYTLGYAKNKPVEPQAYVTLKPKQKIMCYLEPNQIKMD